VNDGFRSENLTKSAQQVDSPDRRIMSLAKEDTYGRRPVIAVVGQTARLQKSNRK